MTANVALTLENAVPQTPQTNADMVPNVRPSETMPDTFDIKPNDVNTDCVYYRLYFYLCQYIIYNSLLQSFEEQQLFVLD